MADKTFSCTDLEGNEVVVTYRTVLSAYDQEKIDEVYMNNMIYNPETQKAEIDWRMGGIDMLPVMRTD